MKHSRTKAGLLAALTALSLLRGNTFADSTPGSGDTDCSGTVNIADGVLLARYLAEDHDITVTAQGAANADINGDGGVTADDLTALLETLANIAHTLYGGSVDLLAGYPHGGETPALSADFIAAQADFSVELLKAADSADENVLLSPLSAALALGMTANGAAGQTCTEMEQVLGRGLSTGQLNGQYQAWTEALLSDKSTKMSAANAIWVRDDERRITVPETFLRTVARYYDAGVYKAPFDESTRTEINDWIFTHTDEMIPDMLDYIDPNAIMYLVNALSFEGEWMQQYTETQIQPACGFRNSAGEYCLVDMLTGMEDIWLADSEACGMMKMLAGGKYSFAAVLPNEKTALTDYIAGLTGEKLLSLLKNRTYDAVSVSLPKFKLECAYHLENLLPGMGMPTAFSDEADFTGLNALGDTKIGRVLHNTAMEVSESGVRAAAATIVEMIEKGIPMPQHKLELNRPFLVMLIDNETDLPVFIGAVRNIGEPAEPAAAN